jgi:hypothetical protein
MVDIATREKGNAGGVPRKGLILDADLLITGVLLDPQYITSLEIPCADVPALDQPGTHASLR